MSRFFSSWKKTPGLNRKETFRRKQLRLESLEDRLLLTAVPNNWGCLASAEIELKGGSPGLTGVNITGTSGKAAVGILVSAAEGSSLNPGSITVKNLDGVDITSEVVVKSDINYAGGASLAVILLDSGEYRFEIAGEDGTSGKGICSFFVPGDNNGDCVIDSSEFQKVVVYAQAWRNAALGSGSLGIINYYQSVYGIDLSDPKSLYKAEYDINADGVVNDCDVSILSWNESAVISLNFFDLVDLLPVNQELSVSEGETGKTSGETALKSDSFTASFNDSSCRSLGYDVTRFRQTGASVAGAEIDADFTPFISLGEDGRFLFNAADSSFDFLAEGEVLTLKFSYYLDNLTFDLLENQYQNLYGGTVSVTVTGKNDSPKGPASYEVQYDLDSEKLSEEVNLLKGFSDPEGDTVTVTLGAAFVRENSYGITAEMDYQEFFVLGDNQNLTLNKEKFADYFTGLPKGETLQLSLDYQVIDSRGAAAGGTLVLTITGKNDLPVAGSALTSSYNLQNGTFSSSVNLLAEASDPDYGDQLTAELGGALLEENDYGLSADGGYSGFFSVDEFGNLLADKEGLAEVFASLPEDKTVRLTFSYTVKDQNGGSSSGQLVLSIAGKNDPPAAADPSLEVTAAGDDLLTWSVVPAENLSDPDGDTVSVSAILLGENTYSVADLQGISHNGFIYTYNAESGTINITAENGIQRELKWKYNSTSGTVNVASFSYLFTDGKLQNSASVQLLYLPVNDDPVIESSPSGITVYQKGDKSEGYTQIGTGFFYADQEEYSLTVSVTNSEGEIVNTEGMADLVTAELQRTEMGFNAVFKVNDSLVKQLAPELSYCVTWGPSLNGEGKGTSSFEITVKPLQLDEVNDTISLSEGSAAEGLNRYSANVFTAQIEGESYSSESFSVGKTAQVSAVSSISGGVDFDYSSCLTFDTESRQFKFNAGKDLFGSLSQDEVLTLTFDYYLNDLTFTGITGSFSSVYGGMITVQITGLNDSPIGAADYQLVYDMTEETLSQEIFLTEGVTDIDGDQLTAVLVSADSGRFNLSSCFSVGADSGLQLNRTALAEALASLPYLGTVSCEIVYQVSDTCGASSAAAITLQVIGKNDAPLCPAEMTGSYNLAAGEWSQPVNLLAEVSDPDEGDRITAALTSVSIAENSFGFSAESDYSEFFAVDEEGNFSLNSSEFAEFFAAVPDGGVVIFNVGYTATDMYGLAVSGVLNLSITCQNDPPAVLNDCLVETARIADGTLAYSLNLLGNLTDPESDSLAVTGFRFGDSFYAAADTAEFSHKGFRYTYSSETGILTISAEHDTIEDLKWNYNQAAGTVDILQFEYLYSDGKSTQTASARLFFEGTDQPAEILSSPNKNIAVNLKSDPEETDRTLLGEGIFRTDRDGYSVSVTVTDLSGNQVNVGDKSELITHFIHSEGSLSAVVFTLNDPLAAQLEVNTEYLLTWTLSIGGIEEGAESFSFVLKSLSVNLWSDNVTVTEGESALGQKEFAQDIFHTEIDEINYNSESFSIRKITQSSAVSSLSGELMNDFSSSLIFDAETQKFLFNAKGDEFDFLSEGESLFVTLNITLDDLVFTGLSGKYDRFACGTVVVSITGVNDKPEGGSDYQVVYDLQNPELLSDLDLTSGVIDPDGDVLTASISTAVLQANKYGIPTENDYSSLFDIADGKYFTLNEQLISDLVKGVPEDGNIQFRILYQAADPFGEFTAGILTLTVKGMNDAPVCAENIELEYDLADSQCGPLFNLFSAVSDPDQDDRLYLSITSAKADSNSDGLSAEADYSEAFAIGEGGDFVLVKEKLAEILKYLPKGESVVFTVEYAVQDDRGLSDSGLLSVTVKGVYEAPKFVSDILDYAGTYGNDFSIDLSEHFTGDIEGYEVIFDGSSDILDKTDPYSIEGNLLKFHFTEKSQYRSDLDLSALGVTVAARGGLGGDAVSNSFTISFENPVTVTNSLACVTENFGGVKVSSLKTGTSNFGTFYYVDADNVPVTNYEAISQSDEYYLEVWVSDTSFLLTNQTKFLTSIQLQFNYDTDGSGITSLTLEDIYAGKFSIDEYKYYDEAETMIKGIQLCWLASEKAKWDILTPITNGENAFLLARFLVQSKVASSISVSGYDTLDTPFVEGFAYTRTGECSSVDESQIAVVDVKTAKTSPISGTADSEYVVDNGVYLRTVTEASQQEKTDDIGANADYIHEWQTHYTEIWVKESLTESLTAVSTNLTFSDTYFAVTDVEFGTAFENGSWNLEEGVVSSISASVLSGNERGDGYVLFARVRFDAVDGPGVLWSESLAPISLQWGLSETLVTTAAGSKKGYTGLNASVDLWVNPYDVNDDGMVNIVDFTYFACNYGGNSTEDYTGAFFDFNRDGAVDLRDFTAFSSMYGISRQKVADGSAKLLFPENFTRRYIGSTLDVDNADLIGTLCSKANDAWAEELGIDDEVEVVIVVKDLADGRLASTQVTETDSETGLPVRGTIYLDDDAAGNRWSAQLSAPASGSARYDLYTVILHELGHLYGYDSESSLYTSILDKCSWPDEEGHSANSDDVMYSVLEPGVRKNLTENDIAAASAVRSAAQNLLFEEESDESFISEAEWTFCSPDEVFNDEDEFGINFDFWA